MRSMDKRRTGVLPTTIALLAGSFVASGTVSEIDSHRQHEARAEAQQAVTDCRDTVRCALGRISLAVQNKFPNLREVDYQLTGETAELGGSMFEIGESRQGFVLVAPDGEYFLIGEDLENGLRNAELLISSREEAGQNLMASK